MKYDDLPELGVGLGYRLELNEEIIRARQHIDFVEIVSDQYMFSTQDKLERLSKLGALYPLIPHGLGLSIGSATELDGEYVRKLAALLDRVRPPWFSDHLSFSKVPGIDVGQLTPLWFTDESLELVCRNLQQVQRHLATPFLLENITYYFRLPGATMDEAEFLSKVLGRTDCGLLLDLNNVHINSINLGFDPYQFLAAIPLSRVVQIHLAGGREVMGMVVDTHSTAVRPEVWNLLDYVLSRCPAKAILLEWDQDYPPFGQLLDHLAQARNIARRHGRGP